MAKVIIVAGPTASGKTAFSQKLAQEKKGVILNGDSLQVYCGLEILTAHPSKEDQKKISHRLYGFLDPSYSCSVGKWLSLILSEAEGIVKGGRVPIVVGGTGLYLKALIEGLPQIPPIDPSLRQTLQEQARPQESLYKELQAVDPFLAERVKPQDRQRTLRGLEVFYGTGKPLSYWQAHKATPPAYTFEKILLMPPKEILKQRISNRLEGMLKEGVLEEVSAMLDQPISSNAQKAIGFKEFTSYLKGKETLEWAKEQALLHTTQYAKRQRTWFSHQFPANIVIPG